MTRESRGISQFRRRFAQACRTLTTRWMFWGLILFALIQHISVFAVRPPQESPVPTAVEQSTVYRGEPFQRQKLEKGDLIPKDARMLILSVEANAHLEPVSLPELQELNLNATPFSWRTIPKEMINDVRVQKVKIPGSMLPASTLRALRLRGAIEIPPLAEYDKLRDVSLEGMAFTGLADGTNPLEPLRKLPALATLSLADSRLETGWLESLKKIPSLRKLRIQNTPLNDDAVPLLIKFKQLKELRISGSQITRSGWQSLRSARPDLKFDSDKRIENGLRHREQRNAGSMNQIMMATGFPAFMLGMLLAVHLKTVFASPRTRMLPGFRTPHMVMAGCLVVLILLPPAVILWLRSGLSPAGPLSVSLLVTVMFAWQSWHMTQTLTLPTLVVWFSLMFGAQTEFIGGILGRWFLTSATTLPALVLLIGTVVWLAIRIATVHEEVPAYGMAMPADGFRALTARSSSRETEKMTARMIERSRFTAWSIDRWFEFSMKYLPAGGTLKRVLLYRIVHGYGLFIAVPIFCLLVTGLSSFLPSSAMGEGVAFFFPAFFVPQFLLGGVGATWLQHGRWHASELLRPQTRPEFVRGIFQAVSLDLAWAGLWLLISQMLLIYQGRSFMDRGPEESIVLLAVLTVGYLTIATAVLLFVLSYQNFWVYIISVTALFVVMAGLAAGMLGLELDRLPWTLPAFAVGCFATAGLVYSRARSRWLKVEFA